MGKLITLCLCVCMASSTITYWIMVDAETFNAGQGLSVPISIFGILSLLWLVVNLAAFISDNW